MHTTTRAALALAMIAFVDAHGAASAERLVATWYAEGYSRSELYPVIGGLISAGVLESTSCGLLIVAGDA